MLSVTFSFGLTRQWVFVHGLSLWAQPVRLILKSPFAQVRGQRKGV